MSLDHDAIRKAYPEAIRIDDSTGAIDKDGKSISLDQSKIDTARKEIDAEFAATEYQRLRTGITGKVVSRGSNYVIYIDEHDNIFRSWLKDLVETKNSVYGFEFTPAGEQGTDELANYMRRMTPGEFIRKINKKSKVTTKK